MAKAEVLSSPANPLLKDVRRAVLRGALTEGGYCVAETFHLLEEALRSGCEVHTVLAVESAQRSVEARVRQRKHVRVLGVPDALFQKISATETSQGVIALVRPPEWEPARLLAGNSLIVAMDGVQDPGNAGTIVRAAEAFGATGVMFLKGTASPFNPKTLRASAGSLFRVPFVYGLDGSAALASWEAFRLDIYAAVPQDGRGTRLLTETDLTRKCALVIGNEARGVSPELRGSAVSLSIPTAGVDSLNAAMAAAILLYEARRQRSLRS